MNIDELKQQQALQRRMHFDRRRFLKGLGACVALPAFESLMPRGLGAAELETQAATTPATTAAGAPVRMAFVYFPNGAIQDNWWPTGEGADFQFAKTMQPLAELKQHVQVLGGLDHINATPGPDGAGDHARANGTFLTGVRVRKTAGSDIHAGISVDQAVADKIGHLTRFPSLELSCEAARRSGNCDSGYSCAYQYNLAWRSPTVPLAPEANPRLVFERLFGAGSPGQRKESIARRQQEEHSILDFIMDDACRMQNELGGRDRQKLDDYLTSVRDVEARIQRAEEKFGDTPDPDVETPSGIPESYAEHIQLMFDMLMLAFQTDSTRVATLLLAHDGSNKTFTDLGFPEGHHNLTHHGGNKDMIEKVAQIDQFYVQQLAKFLSKLRDTKDLDGKSLLDNSMIVYGCGNADGNRHSHDNLPIVLAGGGGGAFHPGRYVKFKSTPACNLFLTMADRMG
ncbi:MAG TPA: DUF1552 domain-containing protein, partial [Pirellulales bacterium]